LFNDLLSDTLGTLINVTVIEHILV